MRPMVGDAQEKKGHVDLLVHLLDLKNHLLREVIPHQLRLDDNVTKALQTHFDSVTAYRKCVPLAPIDGSSSGCQPGFADFAWQGGWPLAHKKLAAFIESVLFKNAFEKEVKQNCVNKQSASEIMTMQTWQDEFNPIKEALAPQQKDAAEDDDAPPPQNDGEILDDVTNIPADLEDAAQATVKRHQEKAYMLVDQSVQILVEAKDAKGMSDLLRATLAKFDDAGCQPDAPGQSYNVGFYDVKLSGEVVTHPHLRVMSFRSEHWLKMAQSFLRAQLPANVDTLSVDNFPEVAVVVLNDGGKGHKQQLRGP